VTPHIKCYTRYLQNSLAWFLLTSANLSKAAWGELQKSETQVMIRNYEIGVLFLPENTENNKKFVVGTHPKYEPSSNSLHFPVPYQLPPSPYTPDDEPWVWDVPHPEPDSFGNQWCPQF